MILPPYLQKGDTVALTSTARFATPEAIDFAVQTLQSWQLRVKVGKFVTAPDNQFAGSDADRLNELHRFAADPEVKAVLFTRGGYGTTRIIDDIDWNLLLDNPKWYCGFSDVTALLCQLENLGMQSMHSPMAAQFADRNPERQASLHWFKQVLFGEAIHLEANAHAFNRKGTVDGQLVGGNLSLINNIIGTASEPVYNGKILFLEDLDEYLYHIDRMMVHLKRSGCLEQLGGLVVGQMSDMNDNAIPFGKNAYEIIAEHLAEYTYPVAFGFPIGHELINYTVKVGAIYKLTVHDKGSQLQEFTSQA